MCYVIETRARGGEWTSHGVGDPDANRFATEAEAEEAIAGLRRLWGDWAAAEYRVVQVPDVKAALAMIRERVRYNGWSEWDDLCDAAGIEGVDQAAAFAMWARGRRTVGTLLLDSLRRAGVRLVQVPWERARFVLDGGVALVPGMGRL